VPKLRKLLASARSRDANGRILVVTESVFSMDGDLCPLPEIVAAVEEADALLWLDEAHAFGVLGPQGMGLAARCGLQERVTFQMGTFCKAAGLSGGYVAASRTWIDLLVNRARAFIYSTAPPPALAHATRESLALIRSDEGQVLRSRLHSNIRLLSAEAESAIIPVVLGTNEAALESAARLESTGFMVPAIRYPTVPRGTARLRVSVSAAHATEVVAALKAALPA
jgi:7-keto-8-aminopelargonate synthetase-like enzyme